MERTELVPAGGHGLDKIKALVIDAVKSANSKAAYAKALDDFLAWYAANGAGFNKATVNRWVASLEAKGLAPATINLRLSAVRKLALEAADNGAMDPVLAQGIARAKGIKQAGTRTGNWLTAAQAENLVNAPDVSTLKGRRDRAILALMIGCGLRRSEVSAMTVEHVQQRDGRWAIVDLSRRGATAERRPSLAFPHPFIETSESLCSPNDPASEPYRSARQIAYDASAMAASKANSLPKNTACWDM